MSKTSFAQGQLKSFVDRIERLEEDKKAIAADIKEIYAEAKGNGFDTKILRKVIALRKKDAAERQEEEAMLEVYLAALGMQPSLFEEEESRLDGSSQQDGAADEATSLKLSVTSSAAQIQEPQSPPLVTAETTAQVAVEVLPAASTVTAPIEPQPGVTPADDGPAVQAASDVPQAFPLAAHQIEDEMPAMPDFLRRDRATALEHFAGR